MTDKKLFEAYDDLLDIIKETDNVYSKDVRNQVKKIVALKAKERHKTVRPKRVKQQSNGPIRFCKGNKSPFCNGSRLRERYMNKTYTDLELKALYKEQPSFIRLKRLTGLVVPVLRTRLGIPSPQNMKGAGGASADQIINWFKAGRTMESIGTELGISRQRVQQVLDSRKIYREDGGLHHTRETLIKALAALYEKEKDVDKVAEAFKCSKEQTKKYLKEAGVKIIKRVSILDDPNWLRREYKDYAKPTTQIARELGVSYPTVISYLKKHGIPMSSYGRKKFNDESMRVLRDGPDWLRYQYLDLKKSLQTIADGFGVSILTILFYMIKYKIPRRPGGRPVR